MHKKLLVISITILVLSSITNAKLIKSYGFKVAVSSAFQKFDYSPNSIISNSDFDWKRKTGINAGLYIEWFNLPIVSFVTQIEYRQVGVGDKYIATNTSGEEMAATIDYGKVNYVSMPLLLKATLPSAIVNPYIVIGPRIDHLLNYSSDHDIFDPIYERFEKTIYGSSFGIGLETKYILPVTTLLEFRYDIDFTDSYSDEYLKVKNNSYEFCLGIGF
jgi:hypothetical protein